MLHPPHIPKCCQHPRSRRARRPALKGSFSQFCSCKDDSSSTTATSTDQGSDEPSLEDGEDMPELSLFKWNLSWNEHSKGIFPNPGDVPITEVESVNKISSLDSSKSGTPHATWNYGSYSNDRVSAHLSAGSSPNTADKSLFPAAGNMESWLAPGNVVWAKTAYHEWWPAEVMDEKEILDCTSTHHVGHVLVQLYGNNEHAWLDPFRDLSQFDHEKRVGKLCDIHVTRTQRLVKEDLSDRYCRWLTELPAGFNWADIVFFIKNNSPCLEERSKNPLEAFQDALKQASSRHANTSSRALSGRCSDEVKSSSQNGICDAEDPSNSSRTKDDNIEEGRGKRKRKMKIHFDELSFPEKPPRRVRRLRIMRYLGLIAPVGSPFSLSHVN